MICVICDHDCHCGDKCDALPMDGGCGCPRCEHMEENIMLKKIWKKIKGWIGLV